MQDKEQNLNEEGQNAVTSYVVILEREGYYSVSPVSPECLPEKGCMVGSLGECAVFIAAQTSRQVGPTETTSYPDEITDFIPLTINAIPFLPDRPGEYWMIRELYFEGQYALNPDLIEQSVQFIYEYHDSLRLRIVRDYEPGFRSYKSDSGWKLGFVNINSADPFLCIDIAHLSEDIQDFCIERVVEAQRSVFNVVYGPVIRFILFNRGDEKPARLRIIIHHLVADMYTDRILLKDLQTVYQQLDRGESIRLPTTTISYKSWVERIHTYLFSEAVLSDLAYWQSLPWDDIKDFPKDYPEGMVNDASLEKIIVSLSEEETAILFRKVVLFCNAQFIDVLIGALALVLARWSGLELLLIAVMFHGRGILGMNVMRTAGCMNVSNRQLLFMKKTTDPIDAVRLAAQQRRNTPNQGKLESWTSAMQWDKLPDKLCSSRPAVQLNYMGQYRSDSQEDTGLFREIPIPMLKRDSDTKYAQWCAINCDAIVINGEFNISWEYSNLVYKRSSMERLSEQYIEVLRSMIDATA